MNLKKTSTIKSGEEKPYKVKLSKDHAILLSIVGPSLTPKVTISGGWLTKNRQK